MKITGKGIIAAIAFLVIIPLGADLLLSPFVGKGNAGAMSGKLFSSYLRLLPLYLLYLGLALCIIWLWKKYGWGRKPSSPPKNNSETPSNDDQAGPTA